MSFVDHAANIKNKLNTIKENEFMEPGSRLIDSAVNLLTETVSALKHSYGEYFNEYNLPNPSIGEGMHYMTSNGYCGTIPLAFEYHKVRDLLLDNLVKYTIDETLFMKNIRIRVENFQNNTLPAWEEEYAEYVRNPPLDTSGGGFGDDSGGTITYITPTPEDFWDRYQKTRLFSEFITDIKSIMQNCSNEANSLKQQIKNWMEVGSEVAMNIALAQHINTAASGTYNKSIDARNAIAVYSTKMRKALDVNNIIKTNYPDSHVARQSICLRDVVCNQLNVKSRSNTIYNNIKSIFERFGITS